MKKLFSFAEIGFTIFALLIYVGGLGGILTLIASGGAGETDITVDYDTSFNKLCYALVYLGTLLLLLLRWKKTLYVLSHDRLIIFILGLCILSFFWSFQPRDTLKYFVNLFGSSLFGIYFVSRYTLKQQLLLLGLIFGISICLSFLFAILLQKYGIMAGVHAGKWRGMFLHKNSLGKAMSMAITVFLIIGLTKNKYFFLPWIGIGMATILLILSSSTSSLLISLEMVAILFLLQTLRWDIKVLIPLLSLVITVVVSGVSLLLANADRLLIFMGKDPSLTGRTPLWEAIGQAIGEHPWLGYGYEGFWKGWNTESAKVWYVVGWNPTHPHNGLLALWLDLGLLGVLVYLFGFTRCFIRALIFVRLNKSPEALWPIAYLLWLVLSNISETNMIGFNDLTWILFCSIALFLQIPFQETLPESTEPVTLALRKSL
jgi:exopolysaccharide production protein ExoQ